MFEIIIFIVLIFLSAFFASSETAIFSVSKFKLHSLVRQDRPGASALARLKSNPNRLLATVLVGNNLVNIFAASLATFIATQAFGSLGVGIATGAITIMIIIFGDSLPKSIAAHRPTTVALFAARPLEALSVILFPVVFVMEKISEFFTKTIAGGSPTGVTDEELKSVIAISAEAGLVGKDAAGIMENVLEFEDTTVADVMTPEVSVVYLDGDKTLKKVMPTIIKSDYSRFPVFAGDEENIVGILDIDFVLREIQKRSWNTRVKELVVPAFIVPEAKKVADLLSEFAKQDNKFALVVDEHGSFVGVVSMEDILEEIVGDIFDKSLKVDKLVRKDKDGSYEVDAKARVADLEKLLRVSLKGEGFTTLAGLIENHIGRIPKKGEKIRLKNFEVYVEEANEKKIQKVRITHIPAI